MDEEDGIRDVTLAKDFLVFRVSLDGFAHTRLAQKMQGVEVVP
jgi:hypothetical protein